MKTITLAVLAASAAASAANADFVDMKFLSTGRGQSVKSTFFGSTRDVFAGQLNHRIANGSGAAAALNGDHLTFCSDFYQYTASSYTQYEVVQVEQVPSTLPMGSIKAAALRDMFAAFGAGALASDASTTLASAFQVAVWEVVTDFDGASGSLDLAAGDFKARKTNGNSFDSAMATQLDAIFAAIGSNQEGGPALAGLKSGSNQDQLVMGFTVPAPGTASLAGLGVLLAGRRRR